MEAAQTAGQIFAQRLREVRRTREWSQERLSHELRELGVALPQSSIAKIEGGKGRSRNLSIEDAMAICAVLGVSPIDMLTPRDPSDWIEVTPNDRAYAGRVRGWWRGWWPLRDDDDRQLFFSQAPTNEMVDRVARRHEAADAGEGVDAPAFYGRQGE